MEGSRWRGTNSQREGRSAKRKSSLTSFCWNPAELGIGLGFLPAASRRKRIGLGKKKGDSLVGPRAPIYLLDCAA